MKCLMEDWRGYINEQSAATIGDLIDAVEAIRQAQSKESIKQKAKAVGGVVGRFMLGIVTAGLSETVAQSVDAGGAIRNIFTAIADPDVINSGKLQNQPWIRLLGIDETFSKIVDDAIEKQILKRLIGKYTRELTGSNRNNPLPNFTNLMAKQLNRLHLSKSPLSISKKG